MDFEAKTWRDAVNQFRMQSQHDPERIGQFLKTYMTPEAVAQTLKERKRDVPNVGN